MLTLNKRSNVIFEKIMNAGGGESAFKIDNAPGAFMALHFEELPEYFIPNLGKCRRFSLAHYYEQEGDLMRDPEMCILQTPDGFRIPYYFRQDNVGVEQNAVDLETGNYFPQFMTPQVKFLNIWLKNIQYQQGL